MGQKPNKHDAKHASVYLHDVDVMIQKQLNNNNNNFALSMTFLLCFTIEDNGQNKGQILRE